MPRPAILLPTLLCALAGLACRAQAAVDATVATPPLEFVISDGQRLIDRWKASIYYTLWQDPANAETRALFGRRLDEFAAEAGFPPLDALAALRGGLLSVKGVPAGELPIPRFSIQAGFGSLTPQISAALTASAKRRGGVTPATVAGAAEAIQGKDPDFIQARIGQVVVFSHQISPEEVVPVTPPASAADFQMNISAMSSISKARQIAEQIPGVDAAGIDWTSFFGDDQVSQLSIVPEGMLERYTSTRPAPAAKPVDRALLARLPANTLLALACGVDGSELWKRGRASLLTTMGKGAKLSADDEEAEVDRNLAKAGFTCTLAQLVEGFNGTTLVAVTPGAPFPALTVAVPRSPALDQVIALTLTQLHVPAPTAGVTTTLTLPGLPVPVQIGMDESTWLLSSDAQLATDFVAGARGGWLESPGGALALSKASADDFAIGGCDTAGLLRVITPFVVLALAGNEHVTAQERQDIARLLTRAASLAAPGYGFAGTRDGRTIAEDRGLLGVGTGMLALVAIAKWREYTAALAEGR